MHANRCYVLGGSMDAVISFIDEVMIQTEDFEVVAPKWVEHLDHLDCVKPSFVLLPGWTRNDDYTVPFIDAARRLMDKYDGSL